MLMVILFNVIYCRWKVDRWFGMFIFKFYRVKNFIGISFGFVGDIVLYMVGDVYVCG